MFVKWLRDGRLATDTVSSIAGGAENLRLRFYPSRGGRLELEELPLPFAPDQFEATHDLRRGVGIVQRRASDVFLIRNFDPRTRPIALWVVGLGAVIVLGVGLLLARREASR